MTPKFRAWDKDKKWMVYDVQDAYDGLWSERNSDEVNDYYGYVSTFQSFTDEESFNFMQYTGLKDKNGVEIYEGDVVELNVPTYKTTTKIIGDLYDAFILDKNVESSSHIEVIGNVYENPELVEELE